MELRELDKININFIIGHGRSGTTLLVFVLNQNKKCIATPEISHFILFYKKYKDVKVVSQELIDDYKAYLKVIEGSKKKLLFTGLNDHLIDALKPGEEINYSRLTKLIYLSLFEDKNDVRTITCIVDKNPYYTFHSDKILDVFPDAKLLIMVRDYRAYILSNIQSQNPAVGKRSVAYYAIAWNHYIKNILRIVKKNNTSVKIFKYEDLVLKREETVKEMVEFFGLEFSQKMMDFHEDVESKLIRSDRKDKANEHFVMRIRALSAPINTSRFDEWKRKLNPDQIRTAESISSSYGKSLGYETLVNPGMLTKIFSRLKAIPAYIRVGVFMGLNSPAVYFYLNVKNKLRNEKKYMDKKNAHS
jgi:hypothetical protein